jgi:hypothetical protein
VENFKWIRFRQRQKALPRVLRRGQRLHFLSFRRRDSREVTVSLPLAGRPKEGRFRFVLDEVMGMTAIAAISPIQKTQTFPEEPPSRSCAASGVSNHSSDTVARERPAPRKS